MDVISEGWFHPLNTLKAHYFINGISLCKYWKLYNTFLEQEAPGGLSKCNVCTHMLIRRKEIEQNEAKQHS